MGTAANPAHHAIAELDADQRRRLEAAHTRLRAAMQKYEEFLGHRLDPGAVAPAHDLTAMAKAQDEVESAQAELWSAREELLGWTRPSWDSGAAQLSDWFSEEDKIYDDLPAAKRY